jgi:pilus assembly protein CpaF
VKGGPCVAIRRHRLDSLTFDQLVEWGAITSQALSLVEVCVQSKKNILVSGGTGSGKTSLLRCVASLIPRQERIVTIEDARELHLSQEHVVQLESRPAGPDGQGRVTIGDLFVATLRLRPDRIVIGELRGGEALDLVQAMTSGHGGCLSTIHASSPDDALRRLETLALFRGIELPLVALRAQVASAVDIIVQVERCADGRRWVERISEVGPLDGKGNYRTRALCERNSVGDLITAREAL